MANSVASAGQPTEALITRPTTTFLEDLTRIRPQIGRCRSNQTNGDIQMVKGSCVTVTLPRSLHHLHVRRVH